MHPGAIQSFRSQGVPSSHGRCQGNTTVDIVVVVIITYRTGAIQVFRSEGFSTDSGISVAAWLPACTEKQTHAQRASCAQQGRSSLSSLHRYLRAQAMTQAANVPIAKVLLHPPLLLRTSLGPRVSHGVLALCCPARWGW